MNSGVVTCPDLFDAHPPFQISGSFSCVAVIAKILLQTMNPYSYWPLYPINDRMVMRKGFALAGGFTIEKLVWKNGKLRLMIRLTVGGTCCLSVPNEIKGTMIMDANGKIRTCF